jgi:hypothetical protein
MKKDKNLFTVKKVAVLVILSFVLLSPLIWNYRFTIKKIIKKELFSLFGKKNNICSCNWETLELKRDDYKTKHLPVAIKSSNNLFIKNQRILNKQLRRGKLIRIQNNVGYSIRSLKNSSCHLTVDAYEILKEIGIRFHNLLKNTNENNSYFEISSVLRTEQQQIEIRKKYPNAATLNNSTHSYGVSFDIAYVKGNSCNLLNNTLNTILNQMQAENKILICPEKGCIHITVISNSNKN